MKTNILTVLGLGLLLVVGVYFKHQEEPTDFDKQKVSTARFVTAFKNEDVDKFIAYSKDVRFSSQEERREFVSEQFKREPVLDAGIAGYQEAQHIRYAAIWYETTQHKKQQFNIPLVEDKGRWKLQIGQEELKPAAIGND